MMKRIVLTLAAMLMLACGGQPVQHQPTPTHPPIPPPTPQHIYYAPASIVIPALKVKATVETVSATQSGEMGTPTNVDDVGWWPGVTPGDPGNAVMDGHKDWIGGVQKVFYHLSNLKAGDDIVITDIAGQEMHWKVVVASCPMSVAGCRPIGAGISVPYQTDPKALGMFTTAGPPTLTLYTCSGTWDRIYSDRFLVFATPS